MEFKEIMKNVVGLGLYQKMTTPDLPENIDQYVVAGNARKQMAEFPKPFVMPEKATLNNVEISVDTLVVLIVLGNSMLPEGIKDGDQVLLKKIEALQVAYGDFIVIKVDPEFYQYRHKGRLAHFKSKLRKALMPITSDMSVDQICDIMAEQHNEYLSASEKKDLAESLTEARSYYKDTPLFLSVTYHDGDIHYSLHPQSNIMYKVDIVARQVHKEVVFLSPSDLIN